MNYIPVPRPIPPPPNDCKMTAFVYSRCTARTKKIQGEEIEAPQTPNGVKNGEELMGLWCVVRSQQSPEKSRAWPKTNLMHFSLTKHL